ncbi:hypothetical protein [Nonomuraea dietziae]
MAAIKLAAHREGLNVQAFITVHAIAVAEGREVLVPSTGAS